MGGSRHGNKFFAFCIDQRKHIAGKVIYLFFTNVDDLFVSPSSRGDGTVQIMYQALADFSRQQGWPFVRWITADNNYRGRGSYDKIAEKTHWVTYQLPVA